MSLKKKAMHGFKWLFIARITQKCLTFATFVVLARILEPEIFGLFALAFVVIDGLGMFQSLGIDAALVQRKDDVDKAASTAFFIFPVVGLFLFTVLYFFAPFASMMLSETSLTPVIRTLGLIYIIKCFSRVPDALYSKALNFKVKTLIEITADVVNCAVAAVVAFMTKSVWALVFGYVFKQVVILIGFWVFSPWRPKLEFDPKMAKEMFNFGKFVFGSSLLIFLLNNIDRTLIGKFLGPAMLGFYALAYNLAYLASSHLSGIVSQVMFPAYSHIQDDTEKMREIFVKKIKYISMVSVPFCIGLFFFASDFMRIVYGPKWLPAVSVLRILVFAGLMKSLTATFAPVLMSLGKTRVNMQLTFFQTVVFAGSILPLMHFLGVKGAAVAVLMGEAVVLILGYSRISQYLGLSVKLVLRGMEPVLKGSFLMGAISVLVISVWSEPGIALFAAQAAMCALVYGLYLIITKTVPLPKFKAGR